MTSYKVGYFVGSLSSTSINRTLSKALIRLAPDDLEFSEIRIDNLALYSQDYDQDYPPEADRPQGRHRQVRRHPVRHPGIQPLDPGSIEERDRLGLSSVGPECIRPHPCRGHRRVDRADRHRARPAEPAARAQLLQRSADDRAGGLHPILTGGLH